VGRVKNSTIVFRDLHKPSFPRPRFDHLQLSGRGLHHSSHPVLLEFNRADIVQRRVHSCSVMPEQPGDGFILGLADRLKTPAMQPFHLQRSEQRLRAGVVPTVALAAHRRRNAMLFEDLTEALSGVLAAAKINPASLPGLRLNQAISRASITRLRCMSGCIDQPATL